MKKYVITKSALVAETLKSAGYTLLSSNEKHGIWTFHNDGKRMLSDEEKKDMAYSDRLFL